MNYKASAFGVLRLNPDGTPDAAFGTNGFVTIPSLSGWTYLPESELAVQADGRIIIGMAVVAQVPPPGKDLPARGLAAVRLNADGALDTTFGTGGLAVADFGQRSAVWFAGMAAGPDGSVVLVANSYDSWAVARITAAGVPDPAFDGDGKLLLNVGGHHMTGTLGVSDVAVDAAGRVVISGQIPGANNTSNSRSGGTDGAVVRLTRTGASTPPSTATASGRSGWTCMTRPSTRFTRARRHTRSN
jgi:uncharacterized delta-60 repeat protein